MTFAKRMDMSDTTSRRKIAYVYNCGYFRLPLRICVWQREGNAPYTRSSFLLKRCSSNWHTQTMVLLPPLHHHLLQCKHRCVCVTTTNIALYSTLHTQHDNPCLWCHCLRTILPNLISNLTESICQIKFLAGWSCLLQQHNDVKEFALGSNVYFQVLQITSTSTYAYRCWKYTHTWKANCYYIKLTFLTHNYSFKVQFDDVTWCNATQKKDPDPVEEWDRKRYHPKDNSTWQLYCLAVKNL